MRQRQDVYSLPQGDETLVWYARAVGAMKELAPTDPLSWWYQGQIHGVEPAPPSSDLYLNQCQHASSFFLPWHRMYILHFERIVAKHVADLGGPADWALPYWNYTTTRPETLALPPAFRPPTLADGSENPLFVRQRNPRANQGRAILGPKDVTLACLRAKGDDDPGFFGGAQSAHAEGSVGALELAPHNAVHRAVGQVTGGWMADPSLAALDPIFWLHHANIDRLWEVWLKCDPAHQNLSSAYWLTGVEFHFHDAAGTPITMRAADVLSLSAPVLDYGYADTVCPGQFQVAGPAPTPPPLAPAVPTGPLTIFRRMPPPQHELVGATNTAVRLGDQVAEVAIPTLVTPRAFHESVSRVPAAPNAGIRQLVTQATLQLEQVTSQDVAPAYDVYLNVPAGADPLQHEDRFVGRVAMFGIKQASDPNGQHGGGGQTFALDITDLYHRLSDAQQIGRDELKVTFVPVDPLGTPNVTVGRVSLYFI